MSQEPQMSDQNTPSKGDLREEADSAVVGPGVVATKSQTQGGIIGTVVGTVIGVVLGLIVGALFFDRTSTVVITVIAFAVAGATAGGTSGGFLRNRGRQQRGDPDV